LQHADFGLVQLYDPRQTPLKSSRSMASSRNFSIISVWNGTVQHVTVRCGGAERIVIEDVETDAVSSRTGVLRKRRFALSSPLRCLRWTENRFGVLSNPFPRPHRASERELRLTDLFALRAAHIIRAAACGSGAAAQ